ncbi:MAG: tetratricopeptide repeat protein [Bacteroidia bacterium]|nr:tetratricopeptide repeat protein [Bacteroidia bacterium]
MKYIKRTSLIVAFLFIGLQDFRSQSEKIGPAFTKSIKSEADGDYKTAIAIMKEVYDKSSYEVNLRLGWLHYLAGMNKESVTYYQSAIDLKPHSIEARLGYVYPAAILGNMDQVKTQYLKIIEIDPQNSVAHYRLGYLLYEKKDYQGAYKHFLKVVDHYPFGYDGLLMLAWTELYLGKKTEAKVLFTKVLWLYPEDKSAKDGIGQLK